MLNKILWKWTRSRVNDVSSCFASFNQNWKTIFRSRHNASVCLRFAGRTSHSAASLLISIQMSGEDSTLCVNCEKMVICSIIFKQIKESITGWWLSLDWLIVVTCSAPRSCRTSRDHELKHERCRCVTGLRSTPKTSLHYYVTVNAATPGDVTTRLSLTAKIF